MANIARIKPYKWTFVTCWNMLGLCQQNGYDKSINLLTGSHVEEYYTHDNCSSIANKSIIKKQNHIGVKRVLRGRDGSYVVMMDQI